MKGHQNRRQIISMRRVGILSFSFSTKSRAYLENIEN